MKNPNKYTEQMRAEMLWWKEENGVVLVLSPWMPPSRPRSPECVPGSQELTTLSRKV